MTTNLFSMNRRAFLGSLMTAPLLTTACQKDYGQYFDIEWDEEVELHNGRIIIVHIKRTFERIKNMRYSRWKGKLRATEISFDAGGKIGYYRRRFNGYNVICVNFNRGIWYILLVGLIFKMKDNEKNDVFNEDVPVLVISSNGVERNATSWSDVPYFQRMNIMPITPSSEGVSQFNGTLLTIPVKMAHWKKYPRAAGDGELINVNNQQPLPE